MDGVKFISRVKELKAIAHALEENLGAVFKDNTNVEVCINRAKQLIRTLVEDIKEL